ncbi:MAG: hypothetical protein CFE21_05155 [Bacteroidetes bacterium B1(2017)]|nr:MAG: hypothetical protein CFE21_05155 [Bacteroidetes bacterium B1(2017)]
MFEKLFLNVLLYLFLFAVSSILLDYFDFKILKTLVLAAFAVISIYISIKLFPYSIDRLYSLETNKKHWLLVGFILPVFSFFLIYVTNKINGYLAGISFDYSNVLGVTISQMYVAITEELFYRGLIFYTLYKTSKKLVLSVLVSSMIFSLFHGFTHSIYSEYQFFISSFILGVILCLIFILSKSIWPSIVFHFINNFLCETIDFNLGVYEKYLTALSSVMFLPFVLPLLFFSLYFYFFKVRKLLSNEVDF